MPLFTLIVEIMSGVSAAIGIIKQIYDLISGKKGFEKADALRNMHAAYKLFNQTGDKSALDKLHNSLSNVK